MSDQPSPGRMGPRQTDFVHISSPINNNLEPQGGVAASGSIGRVSDLFA
jgi:hypothetical protein